MRIAEPVRTTTAPVDAAARAGHAWLMGAAAFFAGAVVLHNADHLRRGADAISREVFWLGTAGIVLELTVVVLVCQRHRLAPLAAAVAGFTLGAGYVVVHFLPARSWFSDSFTSATNVNPLSWSAASLEVVAAIALGVAGLAVLRQLGGVTSAARVNQDQRTLGQAMLHPLALAFAASQVVVVIIAFAQL